MRASVIDEEVQPWRDLGLWFGDMCRYMWLSPSGVQNWASKLRRARSYRPKHHLPPFMRAWHLL